MTKDNTVYTTIETFVGSSGLPIKDSLLEHEWMHSKKTAAKK